MLHLNFDGKQVVLSTTLRKILFNLLEENEYSGESEIAIEFPVQKKKFNYYKRYFHFY